jgi:hypothetical protein
MTDHKVKAECVGGPMCGEVVEIDERSTSVRFPGRGVYHVMRRLGVIVELRWEGALNV